MSSKDNLALDLEHGVRRWDRGRWISVFSSHNPTIREVTECLGLGLSASSSTTNRGIPKFDNPDYRKLSTEVTKLSKELPKEREALLDFAADPTSLDHELEELLGTYGPAIWSKDADRTCLLTSDPTKKTYNKDLFYEEPEHREILKIHLHRWIIIKACYYIRNMKLKRPSGANDYDTLADIDGESQLSPHGTPHSQTPPDHDATPGTELDVKPVNGKKRKSEAFGSLSDGEEHSATPNKRQYSTMPVSRRSKSPRKSLHAFLPGANGSIENIPPLPSRKHRLSPAQTNGAEHARVQLSTLSNNELNGTTRQSSGGPTGANGGFTAVNSGGFTAVNTEASRDESRKSSREPQQGSPTLAHREGRAYTSPYDPTSSSAAPRHVSESSIAQPPAPATGGAAPTAQKFQVVNGATETSASIPQDTPANHVGPHAHIAPQPTHQQPPRPSSQSANERAQTLPPSHSVAMAQERAMQQARAQTQAHSRAGSPSSHLIGRSLAPHPPSRSNTPQAQAALSRAAPAPNASIAPAVQTAPAYGMSLVSTQSASNHPHQQPQRPEITHHQPRPAPVLKSQPIEQPMPQPQSRAQPPHQGGIGVPLHEFRMQQCDATGLLLQFFYPRSSYPFPEADLLNRIHNLWIQGETLFRSELGSQYNLIRDTLVAWLQERSSILHLTQSMAMHPVLPAGSMALVDRLIAMNELRNLQLKRKNISAAVDGVSPDDFLVRAFVVMSNTEGTEQIWKEGLRVLERTLFEFLRREDCAIVVSKGGPLASQC